MVYLTLQNVVVTSYTARSNFQKFCLLPTKCICVSTTDIRTNSDYFPIQHSLIGFYNQLGMYLLCGTN